MSMRTGVLPTRKMRWIAGGLAAVALLGVSGFLAFQWFLERARGDVPQFAVKRTYDEKGRVVRETWTRPSGEFVRECDYDPEGRLVTLVRPKGSEEESNTAHTDYVFTYTYDTRPPVDGGSEKK